MARSRTVRIPDADPPLASNPRENGRTFFAPRLKIDGKNEPDAPPEPLNGTASRRTMFEVFVEFNRQRETRTKFRLHSHTVALSEERAETKQGGGEQDESKRSLRPPDQPSPNAGSRIRPKASASDRRNRDSIPH